jgi:two-component system invasion response regulator UvrY
VKRVIVVDDHDIFRAGLVELLRSEPGIEVVADCPDGNDAVRIVDQVRPDLIVMDLQMPGMNGADATREVLRKCPDVRIVIVTAVPHSPLVAQALAAGAVTCVPKGNVDRLLAALHGS